MQRSGVTKRSPTVAFPAADNDSDFQDIFSGDARLGPEMQWSRPRYDGTHHSIMAGHNRSKSGIIVPARLCGASHVFLRYSQQSSHGLSGP
jgi:hypothetical protein